MTNSARAPTMPAPSASWQSSSFKPLFRTASSPAHNTSGPTALHAPHHRCRRHRPALWQLSTADSHLDDNRGRPNRESRAGTWRIAFELHGGTWTPSHRRPLGNHPTLPRSDATAGRRRHIDALVAGWPTGSICTAGENLLLADSFHLWWTPQMLPNEPSDEILQ